VTTAAVIANPRIAADLGFLGEWLEDRGIGVHRLIRDDVLPIDAADDADVLIVMGSIWTLADGHRTDEYANAIDAEVDLVQRWVRDDRPMLGICFGGQVLSTALGGTVTRMPQRMIAWQTPASEHAALRAPWALWHEDRFSIPERARPLAMAPHAPMGIATHRAWGVQFHPEFTADIISALAEDLHTPDEHAKPMIDVARERVVEQRVASAAFFDAWWADVHG
jgi:GMP synthase-like glutamine amidotransferase